MSLAPSSPRLPSPPPPTEIQFGLQSPSLAHPPTDEEQAAEEGVLESNSARRIHPGTKSADMAAGPPLMPLAELDSAFQLQEHLKALHYEFTKSSTGEGRTIPINRRTASTLAQPPDGVDQALWLYELCRFLINKCNDLIVGFLFDSPPCSSLTCPEMRASEWQFLCAVHEAPKSCCAIDYCCHTLDWATNIVTSQKIFPSRLSLEGVDDRSVGVKHLINIFRRLHRIFAHAWFQHRGVFWEVEGQSGLYVFFKSVCDNYDLLPAENYKLPPEAEGLETPTSDSKPTLTILKPESTPQTGSKSEFDDVPFGGIGRTNTRRHVRSSPSTGSAVTTVLEAEEDDADISHGFRSLQIQESEVPLESTSDVSSNEGYGELDGETLNGKEAAAKGTDSTTNIPEVSVTSHDLSVRETAKHDGVMSGEAHHEPQVEIQKEPVVHKAHVDEEVPTDAEVEAMDHKEREKVTTETTETTASE